MDTSKIIKGVVNSGRYTVTAPVVKEDYGLYLQIEGVELPQTYEVDFSNSEHSGTSVTMIGNSDGVLIPHQFIDTGKDIFAFLYHVGDNYGKTVYKFRIPNKVRPDRTNEEPTPEEQSTIDQLIGAMNTAVAQTAQDVIDADASAQSAQGYAEQAETAKSDAQTFAQRSANSAQASADYSSSAQASATASAQSASQSAQIKADVEELVDDAQASADASEQSASNAHTYATSAEQSSVNASASAQSASQYASQAQSSTQTASTKAQDASGYAQTATQKATEASQSASQALSYKTDAESAKTASQTAQGLAEQAQVAAETAQGKAEDAQAAAESVAESIPSDYSQLSEDVSDLKEGFSEVSAVDYLDIFVETTDTYIAINGTETSGAYHGLRDALKGETYKIKSSAGPSVRPYVFMVNGQVVDYYEPAEAWGTKHDYDITFTAPSDGILYINTTSYTYIGLKRVDVVSSSQANVNENTKKINDFSTVYESVNLFDASQYNLGFKRNNGVVSTDESFCYTKPIYLEAGSYLYPSTQSLFGNNDKVYLTDEWGVNISASASDYQINADVIGAVTQAGKYNSRDIKKFTLTEAHYVCINIGKVVVSDTPTAPQLSNFMLIAGSTVDDYPMYIQGVGVQQRIKDNLLNALSGLHYKVAIFDGDSISAGASVGSTDPTYRYGWGGRIGKANDMNWRNLSVSGGVITSALNSALTGKHSVVDTIDTIYASYPDLDYYIFEGGTNDADLLGNAIADPTILGTFSETDFSGSYDVTTFTGAMETICSKAISYWKGKRIGYVVAPKMGYRTTSWDSNTVNRRAYFERAMKVCEKWGVPYINLWDDCYLNPANPSCYDRSLTAEENIAQGYLYVDGQHLTAKGYDYISPIIEAWMKTL